MEFPRASIQERVRSREHENERKALAFLKEFFREIIIYIDSGVNYILFGKSEPFGTDKWQFDETIQISKQSNSVNPTLNFVQQRVSGGAVSGDTLGAILFTGYDGTSYNSQATVLAYTGESWAVGTRGAGLRFKTTPVGTGSQQDSGEILPSGSWAIGTGAVATNASSGFAFIPTCAGIPTGTPESVSGRAAIVIDSTNNKAYIYSGGAWVALN